MFHDCIKLHSANMAMSLLNFSTRMFTDLSVKHIVFFWTMSTRSIVSVS